MTLALSRAVGLLAGCLTAVSELKTRSTKDEVTVRRAIRPQRREVQIILEQHLLAEVAETLPTARREVQVLLEHLADVVDYSRQHPVNGQFEQSLERAEQLAGQLIDEVTAGKPKEGRITPDRVRTRRPFRLGYKGGPPALRRTERGTPHGRSRRSHSETYTFVGACY